MADFPSVIDLAALDGTNGFRIDGVDAGDFSGRSVSSAGDVNGDGFDDLIIGAREADPGGRLGAGESYVVFGKASGFAAALDLATLDGSNGFRLDGIDAGDFSGWSVSSAGDVNGDGFDDLIIGAYGADPGGDTYAGESYVVFGRASGFTAALDLATLDGSNGFRLDGIDAFDFSGLSVSSAGDVNGDGFDDLIIGAYSADPGGNSYAGESYVVFGKASGFAAALDLATLDGSNGFRLDGIDAFDRSGRSVSSAGDVNGDGFDDLIIGASHADPGGDSRAGESYVVFGKASGFAAALDLATLDGSNGFRLDGIDAGDGSGRSVSSAGDVNGDGFDDLIIGAYFADPGGDSAAGESYVVFGRASGFAAALDLATLDGSNGFRLDGIDFDDRSGLSVSSAGDVNGDGFGDLIIGAPNADPGGDTDAGESYVVFGRAPSSATVRFGADAGQTIRGGAFDDRLAGLAGNDSLSGGGGNDVLIDDLDIDTLDLNPSGTTDQHAEVAGYAMPTGSMTAELLMKVSSPQDPAINFVPILSYAVPGDFQEILIFAYAPGTLTGDIGVLVNGTTHLTGVSTSTIMDGAPHRLSLSYDSASGEVLTYLDGDLIFTGTSAPGGLTSGGTLIFGQEQDALGGGFNPNQILRGEVADIRVFSDVRSADEIADNAFSEIADPVAEQGLVSNWRPDPGNTTSIADAAGGTALTLKTVGGAGTLPGFSNFGSGGDDTLDGGTGVNTLDGGTGDDLLIVSDVDFDGERLFGRAGNDTVDFSAVTLAPGAVFSLAQQKVTLGADTAILAGIENVVASKGDDIVNGNAFANVLTGRSGNDVIRAFDGNDTSNGGPGDDSILGGAGDDQLSGANGADTINGQSGEDTIRGGNGNDSLLGSFLNDMVFGDAGNDFLDGGSLDDMLDGGADNDTINGVTGNDTLIGGDGNDELRAGKGTDELHGGNGSDLLAGGLNADALFGGPGGDTLQGQDGLDTLDGGGGLDVLVGGANADTFVFASGYGRDTINDFADNQDVLQLNSNLWTGTLNAQQVVNMFATVVAGNTVFDFGTHEVTVVGISNKQLLVDDIVIV